MDQAVTWLLQGR